MVFSVGEVPNWNCVGGRLSLSSFCLSDMGNQQPFQGMDREKRGLRLAFALCLDGLLDMWKTCVSLLG